MRPSAIESLLLDVSMVYNVELVSVLFAVIGVGNLALNERRLSSTSWVLIFLVSGKKDMVSAGINQTYSHEE